MEIINTYKRPIPKQTNKGFKLIEINSILTQDRIKQFAVYIGIGDDNFVSSHGQKLNYDESLHYYPMLKKEEYRK